MKGNSTKISFKKAKEKKIRLFSGWVLQTSLLKINGMDTDFENKTKKVDDFML